MSEIEGSGAETLKDKHIDSTFNTSAKQLHPHLISLNSTQTTKTIVLFSYEKNKISEAHYDCIVRVKIVKRICSF